MFYSNVYEVFYREKCDTVNQLFLWQVVVVFKITVAIKESCLLMNAEIHLLPWEETGKLVFVKLSVCTQEKCGSC